MVPAVTDDMISLERYGKDPVITRGKGICGDEKYTHKPWVIKWNGIVYHFYNAVGDQGRVIALATSTALKNE